jgi:hypothetical protein
LIPYAREGIERLWKSQSGRPERSPSIAGQFIEKRFQIRFELPPLVLTDWQDYLGKLLEQAFPDHDRVEFHPTYRVFAVVGGDSQLPTPRDLKLFVNQIGAIHRQWVDAFPLPQIAYYVLLRGKNTDVIKELREGNVPVESIVSILGDNATDNLAAIAFNTEVNKARQLLLKGPLTDALVTGDEIRLEQLAQSHPDAFWVVLENVPFGDWYESEGEKLANAGCALSKCFQSSEITGAESRSALSALVTATMQIDTWPALDGDVFQGMAGLVRLRPDTALAEHLLEIASSAKLADTSEVETWVAGMVLILQALDSVNLDASFEKGLNVPGEAEGFIQVCACLTKEEDAKQFAHVFRPDVCPADVVDALDKMVSGEALEECHVDVISMLNDAISGIAWEQVIDSVIGRIKTHQVSTAVEITALLSFLWQLGKQDHLVRKVTSGVHDLANSGHTFHLLHRAVNESCNLACSWCIFLHLHEFPDGGIASANAPNNKAGHRFLHDKLFGNPDRHAEMTTEFVGLLAEQRELALLFRVVDSNHQAQAWIGDCVSEMAATAECSASLPVDVFIEQRGFIRETLDAAVYDKLIKVLIDRKGLLSQVQGDQFDSMRADLYLDICRVDGTSDRQYKNWCVEGLRRVDKQIWLHVFEYGTDLIKLVIQLYDSVGAFTLHSHYLDGLVLHAKTVINGGVVPQEFSETWRKLFRVLQGDRRQMLRAALLDAAEEPGGDIASLFFDLYGDEISSGSIIRQSKSVVRKLFVPLIVQRNTRGIQWLADLLSKNPDILENYDPQFAVSELKLRVNEALQGDLDAVVYPALESIARCPAFKQGDDDA